VVKCHGSCVNIWVSSKDVVAEGQATRFVSIYSEYIQAKDVTRQRMFLETMEKVFGSMNKIIVDSNSVGGQGVVPYLPLNEINKKGQR